MHPDTQGDDSSTAEPSNPPPGEGSTSISSSAQILVEFQAVIGQFDSRVKELESKSSKIEEKLEKTETKIEENKNKSIESLGLFVALFTFISIEFSLFKEVKDLSVAISLTLIIAGLLTFFVLLLHVIIRTASNSRWWIIFYLVLLIIALCLVGAGIYFPKTEIGEILTKTQLVASPSTTIK